MTWINALADYIQTNNLGTKGTSLFIGTMPETTILTTCITEYDGSFNETFGSGMAVSMPQLQVRVRGAVDDYVSPRTRIGDILILLYDIVNEPIGGVQFLRVRPTSTLLSMGQDERLRWEFSMNFEVSIAGF